MRETYEPFFSLTLEVKNQRNIFDGLKKLTSGEIINEYACDACKQKVDVEKKLVVSKLPNMLIIHLQRIVFDMDTFMNTKLNSRIEFPNVLNMQPYMLGEVLKQDQDMLEKHNKMTKLELKK